MNVEKKIWDICLGQCKNNEKMAMERYERVMAHAKAAEIQYAGVRELEQKQHSLNGNREKAYKKCIKNLKLT